MKAIFKLAFAFAALLSFAACSDVPMPYEQPGDNPKGDEPSTETVAKGTGTQADPYNVTAALKVINALASGEVTPTAIYVKGAVKQIKQIETEQFGNANYYITDDGNNEIYIFQSYYLGNRKFTASDKLEVGDTVVVYGKFTNYMGNTPETVQGKAYLVSLKSNGGGTSGGGDTGDTNAANGDFENWTSGQPNNWKTTSTAGNATLSQSTDAHGGKYSVKVTGTTSANKRLGYKEMTLKAGEYTMTFYVKAATSTGGSVRPGYVPVTDGKVGNYIYGDYVNDLTNTTWTKVTYKFTIAEEGTYSLVIMNSKKPGGHVLIDDFTLTLGSTSVIK